MGRHHLRPPRCGNEQLRILSRFRRGLSCSLEPGHRGPHIALGMEGQELGRWPQARVRK